MEACETGGTQSHPKFKERLLSLGTFPLSHRPPTKPPVGQVLGTRLYNCGN